MPYSATDPHPNGGWSSVVVVLWNQVMLNVLLYCATHRYCVEWIPCMHFHDITAKCGLNTKAYSEGVLLLGWFMQTRWLLQVVETSGLLVTLNEESCHHTVCSRLMWCRPASMC